MTHNPSKTATPPATRTGWARLVLAIVLLAVQLGVFAGFCVTGRSGLLPIVGGLGIVLVRVCAAAKRSA